jgi:hypothetical protein
MTYGASYNPKGGLPSKPTLSIRINSPTPVRTFGKMERREPPLSAICPPGKCMLQSSKEQPVPHCSGKCRLTPDPDKPEPTLPKPPSFPKS